jgi:FeS assembly protein IscX
MRWTDTFEIVDGLCEQFPDEDPQMIRFTDLHQRVCKLEGFADDPNRCNEKILEAIQMTWIDEASDD